VTPRTLDLLFYDGVSFRGGKGSWLSFFSFHSAVRILKENLLGFPPFFLSFLNHRVLSVTLSLKKKLPPPDSFRAKGRRGLPFLSLYSPGALLKESFRSVGWSFFFSIFPRKLFFWGKRRNGPCSRDMMGLSVFNHPFLPLPLEERERGVRKRSELEGVSFFGHSPPISSLLPPAARHR